jgi:signal transduction histidine kinase
MGSDAWPRRARGPLYGASAAAGVVGCWVVGQRPDAPEFAGGLLLACLIGLATIAGRRTAMPHVEQLAPFGAFIVIVVLRDSAGGTASGFGALLYLPVLWIALYRSRRTVVAGLVAYVVAQLLPILLVGGQAYPADWRRVLLGAMVATVLAASVSELVANLQAHAARARAIIESQAHIAAAGLDADAAMERIAERASELTDAAGAVVEISDGDSLVYRVATGSLASFRGVQVARSHSLSGLAVDQDVVLRCDDTELDDRVDREMCRRVGLRSMVVVPLRTPAGVLGVLKVGSPNPRAFNERSVETLQVLANVMSSGLADAQAYRRMSDANARLMELDRLKDSFVATVSHELRTPLASIIASAEMLEDGDGGVLTEPQGQMVGMIARNSRRLRAQIENLLDISRIDIGAFQSRPVPTDLAQIVAGAAETIGAFAEAQSVSLEVATASGIGQITADPEQLERVLVNLLSNAVKFTPAGGAVILSARRDGEVVELSVSDTGIGIPAEEQPLLFDRFFRASSAEELAIPGSGLGLAIVKDIIEAHHGTVRVHSEPGHGTRFIVRLPVRPPTDQFAAAAAA